LIKALTDCGGNPPDFCRSKTFPFLSPDGLYYSPMTKRLRFIALLLLAFVVLINSVKAQDPNTDAPIKVSTYLVNIPVVASDRDGRYVAGLTKENFTILQDGEKQPIEFFAGGEAPVSVAIMIDTSGSTLRIIEEIKSAARHFIKVLRPEDQAMIVSFDGRYKFLSELTAKHKQLDGAVGDARLIQVKGFSMYDAIYDVVKNKFAVIQGRKAIILLTDGGEFGDRITEKQLISTLSEADTVVYPILFGSMPLSSKIDFPRTVTLSNGQIATREQMLKYREDWLQKRQQFMNSLGEMTGGRLYPSESKDFKKTFQIIADELKKQYLIGFYPQNVDDGKTHQIAVEVRPKEIVIRTKRRIQLKVSN
jgi:Ca-activated chloride channel family protein